MAAMVLDGMKNRTIDVKSDQKHSEDIRWADFFLVQLVFKCNGVRINCRRG